MEGEHFSVEIEFEYGKHSYSNFWNHWQIEEAIPLLMKEGVISHFFKVSGENKLIMFLKADGDQIDNILYNRIKVINKFGEQIKIKITAIYDYVTFANLANGLVASDTKYEEIESIHKNTGAHHLLDIRMEYRGMTQDEYLNIWIKEIAAALGAKKAGIATDIWKVLGERRVLCITNVDALPVLDTVVLTLPMMKEMGNQMYFTVKRLTKYDKFIEQDKCSR